MGLTDFPLGALIYIFNGTMAFWYGLRMRRAYFKVGNEYSHMFFVVGVGVGIAEYLYGIAWFAPVDAKVRGLSYLIASLFLFGGLLYALKFVLRTLLFIKFEKIVTFLFPVVVALFFIAHLKAIPEPNLIEYGFINWQVQYPFDVIWSLLLFLVTVMPGIYFVLIPVAGLRAILKKIFFGLTMFLGGSGGIILVIFDSSTSLIIWGFVIQTIGFIFLGSIFLLDYFIEERES